MASRRHPRSHSKSSGGDAVSTYLVDIRTVTITTLTVTADTPQDAEQLALNNQGEAAESIPEEPAIVSVRQRDK